MTLKINTATGIVWVVARLFWQGVFIVKKVAKFAPDISVGHLRL